MISTKTWVAAGSTATLLAGGLFLGAPMAAAAPGDAACLQASTQFNATLGLAGVDLGFVNQLELAAAAVEKALADLDAVTQAALTTPIALEAEAALVLAEDDYDAAAALVATEQAEYDAALAAAAGNVDDPTVVAAQGELTLALTAQDEAIDLIEVTAAAYDEATYTLEVQAAEEMLATADAAAYDLLAQLNGDEALAGELLTLFKAFLAACDANAIGVDPAPVAPTGPGVTPVGPAPVAPVAPVVAPTAPTAPTAPGAVVTAPTGTNKGLNVQTAVATEDDGAAVALIAALLAVGVAVPAATAARMRRLERAQR